MSKQILKASFIHVASLIKVGIFLNITNNQENVKQILPNTHEVMFLYHRLVRYSFKNYLIFSFYTNLSLAVRQSVSLRLMMIVCILDAKRKFKCNLGCIFYFFCIRCCQFCEVCFCFVFVFIVLATTANDLRFPRISIPDLIQYMFYINSLQRTSISLFNVEC